MLTLIVRRLMHAVVVLWVVSLLVFTATEVLPGDVAIAIMGQQATPEALEAIRERLGLDRPAPVRYVEWLGGLITGDLGISLANSLPGLEMKFSDLIAERIDDTIRLAGLAALVFGAVIGDAGVDCRDDCRQQDRPRDSGCNAVFPLDSRIFCRGTSPGFLTEE